MTARLDRAGCALSEDESRKLLSESGINVLDSKLVVSAEEAVSAFEALGAPVVMKISSPDILHKTELGGVVTGIGSAGEALSAFEGIMSSVRKGAPDADVRGIIVQSQISGGVEVIIGGTRDPQFGPIVMFGLGGVWVEVFKDVSFRLAPTNHEEASRMMSEIKAYSILQGYRGADPVDMDALADVIVRLSQLMASDDTMAEVDLNPVLAHSNGAVVIDAKMIRGDP